MGKHTQTLSPAVSEITLFIAVCSTVSMCLCSECAIHVGPPEMSPVEQETFFYCLYRKCGAFHRGG